MANFIGVTASNGAKIKESKRKEVEELIKQYPPRMEDGGVELDAHGVIHVWGYDWFDLGKKDHEGYWMDDCYGEEFLEKLAPFLKEKLIIHCIGSEKCRFPLSAMSVVVHPNGKVVYSSPLPYQ